MGKVVEKIKLTNFLDPSKVAEVEALVDTGATMLVLPLDIVEALGLVRFAETSVKYADNRIQRKEVYGVVGVEIKGRTGHFDVLAEVPGCQPLIGQIVLEQLDLVVEPKTGRLMPNPRSPDIPMIDLLSLEVGGALAGRAQDKRFPPPPPSGAAFQLRRMLPQP